MGANALNITGTSALAWWLWSCDIGEVAMTTNPNTNVVSNYHNPTNYGEGSKTLLYGYPKVVGGENTLILLVIESTS